MKIQQGELFLTDLNPVKGHEQSGFRPVLVMQNNILNKNLNTVIVAPITSNLNARGKLTTYFLPKEKWGLDRDSVVLLYQIRTLDKSRLVKKLGKLEHKAFLEVKEQMGYVF